jgi:hypothetical protein
MTRARILADYVSGGTTAAEFDYMDGVTSNVQTQLDAKVSNATHTGDVTGGTALTIATDAVDIAMLSATGTADGDTFLRGDNAWAAAGGGKLVQASKGAFGHQQLLALGTGTDQDTDAEGIAMTGVTAGNLIIAAVSGGYAYYKRTDSGTTGMQLFYLGFIDSSNTTTTFEKYQTYYNRTNDFVFHISPSMTAGFIVPSGCTAIKVIRKIENLFASSIISWASSTDDSLTHCIILEVEQ